MSKLKTINLRGKQYTEVNERIRFFREAKEFQGWSLTSEVLQLDATVVVIKATITDSDQVERASGIAHEVAGSSNVNKTSYVENCETSAWGRALGNLGIGIQGGSIASYEEVKEAQKGQDPSSLLTLTDAIAKRMESAIKQGKSTAVAGTLHKYMDSANLQKISNLIKAS